MVVLNRFTQTKKFHLVAPPKEKWQDKKNRKRKPGLAINVTVQTQSEGWRLNNDDNKHHPAATQQFFLGKMAEYFIAYENVFVH